MGNMGGGRRGRNWGSWEAGENEESRLMFRVMEERAGPGGQGSGKNRLSVFVHV